MSDHDQAQTYFGASVARKEDPAFLTGQGKYLDDMQPQGLLHALMVRSPHAHARIRGIDKTAARAAPGVHAVYTHEDLPEKVRRKPLPLLVLSPAFKNASTQYVLAKEETRYAGEPVAIVVAESRALAEDAADLLQIDYEPLPAVSDVMDGLAPDAPRVHTGSPSNVIATVPFEHGDADAAFTRAAKVVKASFRTHRGGGFSIETRGAMAMHDEDMGVTNLYATSQSPHRVKRILLDILELDEHKIRVIAPDVGGGFGPKGGFYPEYVSIVFCAQALKRPVKWIEDRRENFMATHQERDQYWDLELAVDADARILGIRGRMVHDSGAYVAPPLGPVLPWIAMTHVQGPYVIPNFKVELVVAFTNKVATSPVRGAGRPQAVFVMERLMDHLAKATGLDRAEVRRRNFIKPEQMPFNCKLLARDGRPVIYDSGDYPETQRRTLANADYTTFPARQAAARKQGRYVGIGIANFVEGTGLGPYEGSTVRVATNGKITVYTGAAPQGQSHKTTFAQICADQLGVPPEQIEIVTGDTGLIAQGVGTFAARSAVNAGNAMHLASKEVRHKAILLAAQMMKISPEEMEVGDGCVYSVKNPDLRKTLREIAGYGAGLPGVMLPDGISPGLEHTAYFTPERSTYSNGCHVVEAEVDIGTGHVTLNRYCVVDDCGRPINPTVVHGQVLGGIAHGIGNALLERMQYDENAQPLTTSFADYLLPLATDMPRVELDHTITPSPLNPLGVKGAGEGGTLPAIAAIVSAIENALTPFGVRIDEMPVTPMRIVELIREASPEVYD